MSEADTKRCATETTLRDTTSNAYTCPVDRQPCEVMGPLRDRLDSETYSEVAKDLIDGLPCKDCQAGAADARSLGEASVRLGKHERRILLEAPPTSKCGWRGSLQQPTYRFSGLIVWPEGRGRSAEEAHRRALRKLVAAGLIATENTSATFLDDEAAEMPKWAKAERARSRYWMWGRKRQAVKLTPLGERVVETYRDELEAGRPIRWAKHIGALEAAAHRPPGRTARPAGPRRHWLGAILCRLLHRACA